MAERKSYIVCVPCWNLRQPGGHAAWQCAHHKCVCCGFKAMEAEVRRQAEARGRTDSGFVHFEPPTFTPEADRGFCPLNDPAHAECGPSCKQGGGKT